MSQSTIEPLATQTSTLDPALEPTPVTVTNTLFSGAFIGLVVTQFLTAFNDNMFRWFVCKVGQPLLAKEYGEAFPIALGGFLLTLPFLLVTPIAGYLGDRYSKRTVIVWCKFAEIVLMSLGVAFLSMGNIWILMFILFLMGTQSALFSPAKMGAIPEIVPPKDLPNANGIFGMITIVACAAGMIAGYALFDQCYLVEAGILKMKSLNPAAIGFIGIALIGFVISLLIRTLPSSNPNRAFTANPISEFSFAMGKLLKRRDLTFCALGVATFYYIAITCQSNIDSYAKHIFNIHSATTIGNIAGTLMLGICLGSILAGVWSKGKVVLSMVPMGIIGIGVFTLLPGLLGYFPQAQNQVIPFCVLMVCLGTFASLYYIPLEIYLQHYSDVSERGSVFAATNAIVNSFMLIAMVLLTLLQDRIGISPAGIFILLSILTIPILIVGIIATLPTFGAYCVRCMMWAFCRIMWDVKMHGWEKLPKTGGFLLVPNHVSWVDGVILQGMAPRHIRFMIYANFTRKWYLNWLSNLMGVIPTSPSEGPKAIIRTLDAAQAALNGGDPIGIFPEGQITRTGALNPFQKGIVKIVQRAQVPVYPVSIEGLWGSILSYRGPILWRWPNSFHSTIHLTVGEPLVDVKTPTQLFRVIQDLNAQSIIKHKKNELQIPIRRYITTSKKALFSTKVADSSGLELTGGKLLTGSTVMKKALSKHIGADEQNVAILLPPSCGAVLVNTSLGLMRKVAINLNYTLSDDVMNYCLKTAGVKHVITSKKFLEKRPVNLQTEYIYLEDIKEEISSTDRMIHAAINYTLPSSILQRLHGLHKIKLDDVATIIFTSGSTGEPKGVMLTHANLASNIEAIDRLYFLKKEDTLVGVLPFFHCFGYTISQWVVLNMPPKGVYHFNPLDARQVGKLSEQYKGTILLSTPTFLRSYLKRCPPEQFKDMRLIVAGAEKLPQELVDECMSKINVKPIEGYGSTELSPLVAANIPDQTGEGYHQTGNKLGTVGHPISGVRIRVVNPETQEVIPFGQEGLLHVQGLNVMAGYLNAPEKTAEVLKDGWYNTGDMVRIDDDGFISITGRKSRFSKIAGEMVPHIKVEEELFNILKKHQGESTPEQEGAADIMLAVTAVPDEKKGERLIVLHRKLNCNVDVLVKELSDTGLPNLWIPDKSSFIEVAEIPVLGTGKLDLKRVKDQALELTAKS
jgi:acyl-[acyl-carrier-protein]-phospholipid O-acyltransferase/long-chain-fatty-acid--[acyl-carrier-protein] ligase